MPVSSNAHSDRQSRRDWNQSLRPETTGPQCRVSTPMAFHRVSRAARFVDQALEEVPASIAYPAGAAAHFVSVPRPVPAPAQLLSFDELPSSVIQQLRSDGTRGELRDLEAAREVFDFNVPDVAKTSIDAVEAVTNDPDLHWMHIEPHAAGGSTAASNGVYGPAALNQAIGSRPMTAEEVQEAWLHTEQVAREAAAGAEPPTAGNAWQDTPAGLEMLPMGAAFGAGLTIAHRLAQLKGHEAAGRPDLALAVGQQLQVDAARGAVNGVVRGGSVLFTQALLGANPLTAGIGLVVPDALALLNRQGELSPEAYQQRAMGVACKGALATALVCAGPIGWLGLTGLSLAMAYGQAAQHQGPRLLPAADR